MTAKRTTPSKSLLQVGFRYVPAASTDIGARFKAMQRAQARAEKEQAQAQVAAAQQCLELETASVVPMRPGTARRAA